jgi:hypothetical protein
MDEKNEKYKTIMIRASPEAVRIIRMKAAYDGTRVPRAATELIMAGAKAEGFGKFAK